MRAPNPTRERSPIHLVQKRIYSLSHGLIHLDERRPGCLKPSPGSFFVASMSRLLPITISLMAWPPVFGAENQMDINGGQGLWHEERMVNCTIVRQCESARVHVQSQRDCGLQPKVGAPAPTLGHRSNKSSTTTWLWPIGRDGRNEMAATALRLEMLVGRCPRVACATQPWALGRNPVGILKCGNT